MSAPCYNCPARRIGCHSVCDKYIAFADQQKRIYNIRLKNNEIYYSQRVLARSNNHRINRLKEET